jgi:flagellar basal-body rod modification protein FlgD
MTTAAMAISPFTHASPMASGAKTDTDSGTAATISSNDFLTLLVTEMKNQDPTAQTDPNQYVNQLVQVNSLEQLIEINENLSSALASPTADAAQTRTNAPAAMVSAGIGRTHALAGPDPVSANPVSNFSGNLGISRPLPAAQRVAQALSGRR